MGVSFYKYTGLGNDYLVYDVNKGGMDLDEHAIRVVCDRNYGLGSDGLLVGPIMNGKEIGVRVYNPDGTEAENGGNALCIFAKFLKDKGYVKEDAFLLHTVSGDVNVQFNNDMGTNMTIFMGVFSFRADEIGCVGAPEETINIPMRFDDFSYSCTCVAIGNPHCVISMDTISKELACQIGPHIEQAEYFPNKINTQLLKVIDRNNIAIEIYERGVGYTVASGSGACAAAGAAYKQGLVDSNICVHMAGGTLEIKITPDMHCFMTGNAAAVGEMILSDEFISGMKWEAFGEDDNDMDGWDQYKKQSFFKLWRKDTFKK